MSNLMFMAPWGVRAAIVAGIILVALQAFRAYRERKTVSLKHQVFTLIPRLMIIAALVLILLDPVEATQRLRKGRQKMIVALDTSYSMSIDDGKKGTRLNTVLEVLNNDKALDNLKADCDIDFRKFGAEITPADVKSLTRQDAVDSHSNIRAALMQAVSDSAKEPMQAGVLLISDGRATSRGAIDAARLALARSVPLWTWCLGGQVTRKDVWVEPAADEILAFSAENISIAATLKHTGYPQQSFIVELKDGDKVVSKVEVTPDKDGSALISFNIKAPTSGEKQYRIKAAVLASEADTQNNERAVFIKSVGKKVRVLVIEGQPHWDSKFMVQSLKRNMRVDLTAIYRLGDNRQFTLVSSEGKQTRDNRDLFPRTADDFSQYDIIIMGKGCETFFDKNTEALLSNFVAKQGGGVIFSRGKSYAGKISILSKFDPMVWGSDVLSRVDIGLTGAGKKCPIFKLSDTDSFDSLLSSLPVLDQSQATTGIKPLAVVLAENNVTSENNVLMAYHLYGQGKVVTLNAGGLWRWAFNDGRAKNTDAVYDNFWNGLLRWQVSGGNFLPGNDIALRSERRLYTDQMPIKLMVRTRGIDPATYRPKIIIDGKTTIEPNVGQAGAYIAEAGPFKQGMHRVKLVNNIGKPKEMSLDIQVTSGSVEKRQLSADPELMKKLAEVSEGKVVSSSDIAGLAQIARKWHANKQLDEDRAPLWSNMWVLMLLLVGLSGEWYLRRKEGLL